MPSTPPRPSRTAPASRRPLPRAALWVALLACASCASTGRFVWVDDYPQAAAPSEAGYLITPGDMLAVQVWNQEHLSRRVRVREDGQVSLPLVQDVQAAGLSPQALAKALQQQLAAYLSQPVVTVALEESRALAVAVLGEVARGGQLQLPPGSGVLQALAAAGGFTEYADREQIYVLRKEEGQPAPARIRFTWERLIHVEGRAPLFRLRTGDVVVVE